MSSIDFSGSMTCEITLACTEKYCFVRYSPFSHILPRMLQSSHEALSDLPLALLTLKLTGYKMCSTHSPQSLHSAAAFIISSLSLQLASLCCDYCSWNPTQVYGGNINTEETEANNLILKRSMEAKLTLKRGKNVNFDEIDGRNINFQR